MAKATVGTQVRIVAKGAHFFALGTIATVIETAFRGEDGYFVEGPYGDGDIIRQLIREGDFEVVSEGQALPNTQSEGETKMVKTLKAGDKVRVTGAEKDGLMATLIGQDVTTHSIPIGAVVTVVEAVDEDQYARVDATGLELTHSFAKNDTQWVKYEFLADATGEELTSSSSPSAEVASSLEASDLDEVGAILNAEHDFEVGDEVTVMGNMPCPISKLMLGKDRGIHGVPTGTTLKVLEVVGSKIIVDATGIELLDEDFREGRQSIPAGLLMKAQAKTA